EFNIYYFTFHIVSIAVQRICVELHLYFGEVSGGIIKVRGVVALNRMKEGVSVCKYFAPI
ncbi:hypothetical protein QYM36_013050, partial [Artemia franciscana]